MAWSTALAVSVSTPPPETWSRELLRTGWYGLVENKFRRHILNYSLHHIQRQVFKNLSAVLEAAGSNLKNVVKVNVFLTTMDNFAAMNEAYDEFVTAEPKPVRVYA